MVTFKFCNVSGCFKRICIKEKFLIEWGVILYKKDIRPNAIVIMFTIPCTRLTFNFMGL